MWIALRRSCPCGCFSANVSPDFTPIRSELANAQGFSRGILNLVVLPDDRAVHAACPRGAFCSMPCCSCCSLAATVRLKPDTTYRLEVRVCRRMLRFMPPVSRSGFCWPSRCRPTSVPSAWSWRPAPSRSSSYWSARRGRSAQGRAFVSRWSPVDAVRRRLAIAAAGAIGAAFFASAMFQTLAIYGGNYSGFLHIVARGGRAGAVSSRASGHQRERSSSTTPATTGSSCT